jgi:hypothetical protein
VEGVERKEPEKENEKGVNWIGIEPETSIGRTDPIDEARRALRNGNEKNSTRGHSARRWCGPLSLLSLLLLLR